MPGVRIRPRKDRRSPDNAIIVLVDKSRPIPKPKDGRRLEDVKPMCPTCGIQHLFKTYHLQLQDGSVIVSETIWAKFLAMVDDGGFEFMNYVEKPPTQRLSVGTENAVIHERVLLSTTKERSRFAKLFGLKSQSARAGEGKQWQL